MREKIVVFGTTASLAERVVHVRCHCCGRMEAVEAAGPKIRAADHVCFWCAEDHRKYGGEAA